MKESEFDRFAAEYHATHARNIGASGEPPEFFARYKVLDTLRLCHAAGLAPARILDFGCGIGSSIPWLSRCFPQSEIVGADVSRRSLEIAAERAGGLARFVRIEEGRGTIGESGFDLLFSACVFHHID